ncbi:hypothetical protein ACP275_14G139800 [Erythranthe tilingii]
MSVFMVVLHLFIYYISFFVHLGTPHNQNDRQYCAVSKCGSFENIPFPFYLNDSCRTLSDAFSLSCVDNSSSLFLNIDSESYNVLHFFSDGVLVDFPHTNNNNNNTSISMCRQYNDLRSFPFSGNQYFGISRENMLDLNDCDESYQSELCKVDSICEETSFAGCDGRKRYPSCCYPLTDWRPFSDFSKLFGCRGFSCWVNLGGSRIGKRGIKLEWAVPVNSTEATCAANAHPLNATSVASGIRCQCSNGFLGDGFSTGLGCLKSCFKDGKELGGDDCYPNNLGRKKKIILAGVVTSGLIVVSLTALCVLKLRRRKIRSDKFGHSGSGVLRQKADCRSYRLFKYHELEEATKGFGEVVVDEGTTIMYAGVVVIGGGGSHSRVAVQRVIINQCCSQQMIHALSSRLERLSAVSHRNMARIIGWSIDAVPIIHVVYENGTTTTTFKDHLTRDDQNYKLDWCTRLKIAAETANILSFLQHEISPPIFHHALQSGCIFLDNTTNFTVKLAGFGMMTMHHQIIDQEEQITTCSNCAEEDHHLNKNDVYSLGLVLVEIITGGTIQLQDKYFPISRTAFNLQKIINKGKLEEIVDPSLYYHEQTPFRREQIEIIADLATRCLLFGPHGKLGMADVARELMIHISSSSSTVDGSGILEETFSNSSLLQMISMSPDNSIYLPTPVS